MTFVELPADVELPHEPSEDTLWQESVVLGWADPLQQLGGFIRIGHQPNLGLAQSCFGVTARTGLSYTRTAQDLPLDAHDRCDGSFAAGGFQWATITGTMSRWRAADSNVDLDLQVRDVHPPCDFWQLIGVRNEATEVMAANHLQAGGTFEGTVRVGDQPPVMVSGYTYRDHSWGTRRMDHPSADMYAAWWAVGSLGPDLSFGFGGARYRSGVTHDFGYVVRDGVADLAPVDDASVVMAFDGLSNRGGSITARSRRFGRFALEAEGYGNVWLEMGNKHFEMSMPCTIRTADRVGGGLINTIFNPRDGEARPTHVASGNLRNGLYWSHNGLNVIAPS